METGETQMNRGEKKDEVKCTKIQIGDTKVQTGQTIVKTGESNMKRNICPQHITTLSATLIAFSCGTVLGWSTPAIPYLQGDGADNSTYTITDEEGSWLSSLPAIGSLLGAIPAGFVADLIGRKKTLLILSVPYIISWIMLIFVSENFSLLCLARFISGIGYGATVIIVPVYNEEVSDLKARGTTGVYCELGLTSGTVFSFAVGAYEPWLWYNIASCSIDILFLITFIWMPESPLYLVMKDRHKDAENSLRWLRGVKEANSFDIDNELSAMKLFIEEERALKASYGSQESFLKRVRNLARTFSYGTPSMKAAVISISLLLFQQLNGSTAILFYTVIIFRDAGSSLSPYDASIIVGGMQFAAACVTSRVLDIAGRKPLLVFSEICSIILLTAMGVYFYFKESGSDMSAVAWLPIAILTIYMITAEIGYGATPVLVMAEISPPETKGIITSTAGTCYWIAVFLVTKLYTNMVDAMGIVWTYGFYAICTIVGLTFIIIVVPETKMKTREQIQRELRN